MSSEAVMDEEERQRRLEWFQAYVHTLETKSIRAPKIAGQKYHCPCCGYHTLDKRGGYDICPVCFWEDDGQDDQNADVVRGGPNGSLSLTAARINFNHNGACESRHREHVRPPKPEEMDESENDGQARSK